MRVRLHSNHRTAHKRRMEFYISECINEMNQMQQQKTKETASALPFVTCFAMHIFFSYIFAN